MMSGKPGVKPRITANLRSGTQRDLPFLSRMLLEAFFWDPSLARPSLGEFLRNPRFQLLEEWGRTGDSSVIAECDGRPVGAAWCRLWNDENHSYGYVDSETPELGMAVEREYRSKGIGRSLLRALVHDTQARGIQRISLSVDSSNFAGRLYESEGFSKVGQSGTSWTYVKHLSS